MSRFVTVKTFSRLADTAVIRARLEAEGIECFIPDELSVQINPFYSDALGSVRLQVKEEDLNEALEVLKDGGYIENEDTTSSKFSSAFDKITLKIPLIKNLRYELRLIISGTIRIFSMAILIYLLFFMPTKYELLTKNHWCTSLINYDGKEYYPNTVELKFIMDNDCNEDVVFNPGGIISLPGFNSRSIRAKWHLDFGRLEISKADTFDYVYNGIYEINHSDGELIFKSEKTIIHCYCRFSEYSPLNF